MASTTELLQRLGELDLNRTNPTTVKSNMDRTYQYVRDLARQRRLTERELVRTIEVEVSDVAVTIAGRAPDRTNWFIEPVVESWWNTYQADGKLEKEHAIPGTRFRASWAGKCARALAYHFAGMESSDSVTIADCWRMNIGSILHEHIQQVIQAKYPNSQTEVKVQLATDGSGHMDALVVHPDGKTSAVEIKTINGTGFRRMIGAEKGKPGEGPRSTAVVQGALNAHAMDPQPDELVIVFFALECLSPSAAAKIAARDEYQRFATQYTFTRDEYVEIAERELRRINRVFELVDAREGGWADVPRMLPDPGLPRHRVFDPSRGFIEKLDANGDSQGTGWVWQCGYCEFQSQCISDLRDGK